MLINCPGKGSAQEFAKKSFCTEEEEIRLVLNVITQNKQSHLSFPFKGKLV